MRRVEGGESFTITRNGRPVADLVPRSRGEPAPARTLVEVHDVFREADRLLGHDALEG